MNVDEVLEAALDVFLDRGYRQATLADVAERAGVSAAEVLAVFTNKEDLLEAVLGPGYDDIEALLVSDDLTPEIFLERYVDLSLADRKALTLTMVDAGVTVAHPTLGPRVRPLAARMLAALGATDDEASRVHAWAALATVESTIAFQPGIESVRMRAPARRRPRGAARSELTGVAAGARTTGVGPGFPEHGLDPARDRRPSRTWLVSALAGRRRLRSARHLRAGVRRATVIRDGLRALVATHGKPAGSSVESARTYAGIGQLPLRLDVRNDGSIVLVPATVEVEDSVLAELLCVVAEAAVNGTWWRVKLCQRPTCRWAFYDASPARSAAWCTMQVCGARHKAAAYRRRHAGSIDR